MEVKISRLWNSKFLNFILFQDEFQKKGEKSNVMYLIYRD